MGSAGGGCVMWRLRKKQPRPPATQPVVDVASGSGTAREPLVAEQVGKARRSHANTRVQLFGARVQCTPSQHAALKLRMIALRATRSDWTAQRWKQAVKRMAAQGWSALGHGGVRRKPASVVERSGSAQGALAKTVGDDASAVGEHCGGLSTKAAGDTSAVGEHRGGAQRALAKTGGDVSAVGEGELQRGADPRCRGEEDAF
jgi:hypothetical protein